MGLLFLLLAFSNELKGQTYRTWDGGAKNGDNWNIKKNWGNNTLNDGNGVIFDGTTRLTPYNNFTNYSIAGITFNNGAGIFTLEGNPITLSGDVTNNDADLQTINMNMALSADRTFTTTSGNIAVTGVISGSRKLKKEGSETLILTGNNSYTQRTEINDGTIEVNTVANAGTASSLGTGSDGSDIRIGATGILRYTGTGHSTNRKIDVRDNGGTIDASGTGPLTLTSGITGYNHDKVLTGSGIGIVSDTIFGYNNKLTKNGTGIWILSGSNTYIEITTINAGTLRLGAAGGGTETPLGTIGAGTTVTSGAVLDLNGYTLGTAEALTLNGTGISSGGALTNSSATAVSYTGTIALNSASSIGTTGNITASGVISGGNSLTKVGAGTLILSADNTFSGGLTITQGTVQLAANERIATQQITLSGGTFSTGATTGYSEEVGTLNLAANSTIALGANDHTLTFAASDGIGWTGSKMLTITGWVGTRGSSGDEGKVYVSSSTGLTSDQLEQIQFLIGGVNYQAKLLTSGEVVPAATSCSAPTTQASGSTFSSLASTSFTWTIASKGDGDNVIVLCHEGAAVDSDPVDGSSYATASSDWSSKGTQIGTGNYVVYNGSDASPAISMTNLAVETTYYFKAYAYNDCSSSPKYLTTSPLDANQATATASSNVTDHFRTITDGDWATTATWQSSATGNSNWITSTLVPTNFATSILIQSDHTVYTNSEPSYNNLTVNGTYEHRYNGGTIPTATWGTSSTCLVTGITNTGPSGFNQIFGNFTWNNNSNQDDITTDGNIVVNGDFTLLSGTFNLSNGDNRTLTIAGNYIQTDGVFDFNADPDGLDTMYLAGNLVNTINDADDNMITMGAGATNGQIVFNGSGTQTISFTNANSASWIAYTVNSGSTLQLLSSFWLYGDNSEPKYYANLTVNGTVDFGTYSITDGASETNASHFILNSGATLITANTLGVNGSVPSNETARTFSTDANYTYNGSSAQVTGNYLIGANNLTINNSSTTGVALSSATSVSGTLTLTNGKLTTTSTNLLSVTNETTTAISGGSTSTFINGPLSWTLPESLSTSATYNYPVGKATYLPFSLVDPTTGTGTITAQVEAFSSDPAGTTNATLNSISDSEYWELATSGNFTNSSVSLARQTDISPLNTAAGSSSATGEYSSLAGTINSKSITSTNAIGTNRFFTFGTSGTNCTPPSTQATIDAFTNNTTGTSLTANWTRGNGIGVIVVARLTTTTLVAPSSGTTYNEDAAFGSGNTTGTDNFVVYSGSGTTVDITALAANTSYTFTMYEYETGACYNTTGSSLEVTTPNILTYCSSNFTDASDEWITNVTFAGIDNTTVGNAGANDYTDSIAEVVQGETQELLVTINAYTFGYDYVYAFIDWNQDGDFDDTDEVYTIIEDTDQDGPHTQPITVPTGASLGNTRMRVMVDYYNDIPDPCRDATWGEVEDYTVNVSSALPPPTISDFSPSNGCSGTTNVVITGTNFTNTTTVNFNGVSASYSIDNSTQITATVPSTATTGTISVITSNGTATSASSFTVNTPAQPSTITGSTAPCSGTSQTYSVTNVSGVTYNWTFPTGWTQTSGGTTNSVTVSVGSGTGDISVTPNSGGCDGIARTLAVTLGSAPTTTGVSICEGESGYLTASGCGSTISSGPNNAGTGTDNSTVGSGTWTNPEYITTTGTPYATQDLLSGSTSHYLQGTNYGFSIPTGATIEGITVDINRRVATTSKCSDNSVMLVKAGTPVGSDLANTTQWPNSFGTATYGNTTNLWGTTWTPAEINANDFGVVLSATSNSSRTRQLDVDYMQITISYLLGVDWYTVSSGGSSIGTGSPFNPVGVAGSGLSDTNTPGTTTYYAECSTSPDCRTATDFIINTGSTASVTISANPSTTIKAGAYTTFTATAINGGSSPIYEWQVNGSKVGANAYKYTNLATLNTGDVVSVILTSSLACTSPVTSNTLTINVEPDIDSDGDDVDDADDLDDDNDGIPDIREELCFPQPFTNGGFDENDPAGPNIISWEWFDESVVAGWETTSSQDEIEIWDSGNMGVNSYEGDFHAEINGDEPAMLFQQIPVSEGDVLTWEIAHRGRKGVDSMYIYVGPVGETPELNAYVGTDNDAWKTYRGAYWVASGVTDVFLGFEAGATAGGATQGNFIDFVSLVIVNTQICDEDGNGIADKLDLDSDNDGIYDLWETGARGRAYDTNNDGQLTDDDDLWADIDGDGLFDPVDDYGGSYTGGISLGVKDTDGDGDPDYFDLDSDDDGCYDVIEAGFVDDNNDHLLGNNSPVSENDWGAVTDTINGYTIPNDLNGNGIYDFQEAGTAPSATVDPSDQSVLSGGDASFTSGGTGDVAVWQESIDAGSTWNDITNGGIYSGATTTTLDLTGVTLSMNSYQYRYYLKTRAYACDSIDSSAVAILTVSALSGDWDGDGIIDVDDIDDDNDGIPDAIENDCAPSYPISGFDALWNMDNTFDDQKNSYDPQNTADRPTYNSDVLLGDASASFDGSSSYLQYSDGTFLNQAITYFSYSFWIKPADLSGIQCLLDEGGSTNGLAIQLNGSDLECAIREGGAGSQVTIAEQTVPSDGNWHHIVVTYDNGDVILYLDNSASITTSTGFAELAKHTSNHSFGGALQDAFGTSGNYYEGLMDEMYHYPSVLSSTDINAMYQHGVCDADGDGVANSFDLDSDNDGIYDVVESGQINGSTVVDLNNDGIIDGIPSTFGANGLFDKTEISDDSGTLSQETADSDSDGLYDAEELDSDNDGCDDAKEAGYTDGDNDGLLGTSPTSEDSYGKVTSGGGGYAEPKDLNINSTYDFQEVGTAASISEQPVNVTEPLGDDAIFSVTASASTETYQWQDSTAIHTWANISGETGSSLALTSVQSSMDGNKYRVIVGKPSFACANAITSEVGILSVGGFNVSVTPNGISDCPDLDPGTTPGFNPDNSNYNHGATLLIFTIEPDVASDNWSFDFSISGTVNTTIPGISNVTVLDFGVETPLPSNSGDNYSGTISAGANTSVNLFFTIENTPGSSQSIILEITNPTNITDSNMGDNKSVSYTIDAMPEVGKFE